jgi:hypothetical protein
MPWEEAMMMFEIKLLFSERQMPLWQKQNKIRKAQQQPPQVLQKLDSNK